MKISNWFARDGAERPLIWPCVTLALLFLLDLWVNPHFLSLRMLDGHLFGAPIDILNRAAPLVLVATGMTLVIATRGIDISVGAVVAIAGAAAATMLATQPFPSAGLIGAGARCGADRRGAERHVERHAGGLRRHAADHRHLDPDGGRPWRRAVADRRPDHSDRRAGLSVRRRRLSVGRAVFRVDRDSAVLATALLIEGTALGLFIRAIGVNPVATRLVGLRSKAIVFAVYGFSGLTAAIAGILISSNVRSADGNNAGLLLELDAILAVTLGGTSLLGGRFSLAGTVLGALIIQTLTYTTYSIGVPPEATLVVKAVVVLAVSVIQSPSARALAMSLLRSRGVAR